MIVFERLAFSTHISHLRQTLWCNIHGAVRIGAQLKNCECYRCICRQSFSCLILLLKSNIHLMLVVHIIHRIINRPTILMERKSRWSILQILWDFHMKRDNRQILMMLVVFIIIYSENYMVVFCCCLSCHTYKIILNNRRWRSMEVTWQVQKDFICRRLISRPFGS